MRTPRRVVTVTALVVSVFITHLPAPASTAESEPTDAAVDFDEGSVAYLMNEYGISEQEARKRVEDSATIGEFAEWAAANQPDDFAGVWVDHSTSGDVHIGFTGADYEERALEAMDGAEVRGEFNMVPHRARHSAVGLIAAMERVDTHAHRNPNSGISAVSIDVENNRVVAHAGAEASAEERRAAQSSAGDVPFAWDVAEPIELDLGCTSRIWCSQPLRGGVAIRQDGDDNCTSGFTAKQGVHFLYVTAGHCASVVGAIVRQRDNAGTNRRVGPTWDWEYSGTVDAAIIHIDGTNYNQIENIVYQRNHEQALRINFLASSSSAYPGRPMCSAGRGSGFRCGEVLSAVSNASTTGIDGLMRTNICREGGDSGAPVYDPNSGNGIAFAIHHGGTEGDNCPNTNAIGYHTYVAEADNVLNFTLYTG